MNNVRWAIDLGKQDYNTIEQTGFDLWGKTQDAERWKLLSKNNYGHSTLTVNGQQHVVDGKTELVEFLDGPNPQVTFDMSPAFGDLLSSATRTFVRDGPASITIEDEIRTSPETKQIVWQMTTVADVEPVPGGAILRQDGKSLHLTCLSHPSITVSSVSLDPPPMELDSRIDGLKRIEISIPLPEQSNDPIEFVVRLTEN